MHSIEVKIEIIGVNPFVFVPRDVLERIFTVSGKRSGPIPVCGELNGKPYTQTLVKYLGEWRLYINTRMLKDSPKRVGERIYITIDFDSLDRSIPLHPKLQQALDMNALAREKFYSLAPSRQHEINRYISRLQSEEKVTENIQKAINFLNGDGRFAGRDPK
jgi:hypothetical protein